MFPSVQVGKEKIQYISGKKCLTNPTPMVLEEAERMFGKGDGESREIALILSIGSGITKTNNRKPLRIKRLFLCCTAGLVRNTSLGETPTVKKMERKFDNISGVYFQLNAVLGSPAEDWKDITLVQAYTNKYLSSPEVSSQLDEITKFSSIEPPRFHNTGKKSDSNGKKRPASTG